MANYLVYWKPDTLQRNLKMQAIRHTASGQYAKLRVGDTVWVVSSKCTNHLALFGRQKIDHIVDEKKAAKLLGAKNLWESEYHAIAGRGC